MTEQPPDRPPENPVIQGVRYGTVGCAGCLTFVALAVFLLVAWIVIGSMKGGGVILLVLIVGAGVGIVGTLRDRYRKRQRD